VVNRMTARDKAVADAVAAAPVAEPAELVLLREIRDELRRR
jgi:large-conductance mechanosensitive channel